jgi:hypothetical protein
MTRSLETRLAKLEERQPSRGLFQVKSLAWRRCIRMR